VAICILPVLYYNLYDLICIMQYYNL
jgi:hypothetical protein